MTIDEIRKKLAEHYAGVYCVRIDEQSAPDMLIVWQGFHLFVVLVRRPLDEDTLLYPEIKGAGGWVIAASCWEDIASRLEEFRSMVL